MAKQLYDYWFVQFDFPNEEGKPYKSSGGKMVWNEKLKREIPDGWNNCTLEYFLTIKNGRDHKHLAEGLYPVYGSGGEMRRVNENLCSGESVLMPRKGTLNNIMYVDEAFWTVDTMFYSEMKIPHCAKYIFFAIKDIDFTRWDSGTGVPSMTASTLYNLLMIKPIKDLLKKFDMTITPIFYKMKQIRVESEELAKQRDELLPLLMNGQVSINSDLVVSYIIYKDINIRIMKENIIQTIVAKMQRDLDCRQMARLRAVLASELHNVEIIEKSDCATPQTQENEHLLNSFISAKKIEGCSDKTLAYYRNTIERLLATLSLAICHITTTDIRTYLSNYQEEHQSSKVTIDNMRRIFSSFFAWLEDEDYIAKSPVRRIHKVKTDSLVKEVLSDEQLEQLRDSCTTKRDLAIIDFLSSTGIRVGELVKLNREDIDFYERQCVVFGKGNKERVVYFNARTKLHLQQYLNERIDDNPALFVSLNSPHSRLTISGVEIRIRKLGQSLSMPKVHPHKFRRTLATMAIDKGMPIEQVQRLLGHVRIDTTLHYAIVNQNNVKLAHKKYLG